MNNFKRCIQEDSDSEDDNICDFNLIINKYHDLNDNRQLIVQNDNDIVIERKYKPMIEYPECLIYDDGKIFNNETQRFYFGQKRASLERNLFPNRMNRKRYSAYYMEKLVAMYFLPNDDPINKTRIIHKNNDNYDDRVENLEWCTSDEYKIRKSNMNIEIIKESLDDDVEWIIHPGNPLYLVINDGRLYHGWENKFYSLKPKKCGYVKVKVSLYGKSSTYVSLHKIIAELFVPNPKPKSCTIVDHLNNDKLDNRYTNLCWANIMANSNNKLEKSTNCKIIQYDLEYNVVKVFKNITEAKNITKTCYLTECLKGQKESVKSRIDNKFYMWGYDDPEYGKKQQKCKKPSDCIEDQDYPNYFLTKYGQIYSDYCQKFLCPTIISGYYIASLINKEGKHGHVKVHRLICYNFSKIIPKDYNKLLVNHINGDQLDNRAINLEYTTHAENTNHAIEILGKIVKRVQCYDTETKEIQIFKSVGATGKHFNLTHGAGISTAIKCCNKGNLYRKRYVLSYYLGKFEKEPNIAPNLIIDNIDKNIDSLNDDNSDDIDDLDKHNSNSDEEDKITIVKYIDKNGDDWISEDEDSDYDD